MNDDLDGGSVLATLGAAVYSWSALDDRLEWWPHAPEGFANASPVETGTQWAALTDPDSVTSRRHVVLEAAARDEGAGAAYEIEYPIRIPGRGGARLVWIEDIGRCRAGPDGQPLHASGVVRIISSRGGVVGGGALHSRLDVLTGTLARPRLLDTLEAMIVDARRFQTSCAFLLLAVETPNALVLGDAAFDEVLAGIAARLRASMRGGDAIGRFSSHVFGLAFANCTAPELSVAAQRMIRAAQGQDPEGTADGLPVARVSGAGLVAPRHAESSSEAAHRALDLLNVLREQRRGGCAIYSPNPQRDEARRRTACMAGDLVSAVDHDRIALLFQPVVEAASGELAWYEALTRMRADDGTALAISPHVEAAEQLGFAHLLDHRVAELALGALAAHPGAKLAVNVSATTLEDPDWSARLIAAVRADPELSSRLLVEITETAAPGSLAAAEAFVAGLRASGIRVALDDFGAGQTSFRALRRLGVDLVKIDGEFVAGMIENEEDRAYVRTIIGLAHSIGFKTVAERVENEATAALLRDMGADYLQGALYGAAGPLPD